MDVGHAAGATNAAAAAAHAVPRQAPVDEFVPQVDLSTGSSTRRRDDRQHVLERGQGHKHGVIKHLSHADLQALVGLTAGEASARVERNVDVDADVEPDPVSDAAPASENRSPFSERVTQNLLAEVARRHASAEVAAADVPAPTDAPEPPEPTVTALSSSSEAVVDLTERQFPDPTLATILREMAQFEAPEATQPAQLS